MKQGDPIDCRCPACGSRDVNVYEHFLVSDLYEVRDGKLVDRIGDSLPQATGSVDGECVKCRHRWRFRKNPIQDAGLAENES